jgi:hypothetical protein
MPTKVDDTSGFFLKGPRENATERWPPSLPQLQWESRVKNSTTTEMKSTKIVIGGENFADGRQKARKQKVP